MSFRIGLSADLSDKRGGFAWGDMAITTLADRPWEYLIDVGANFTPEATNGFAAIAFAGPGVIAGSFGAPESAPAIIARLGVGYDNIDLAECTRAGVALTITPDGSRQPVAGATLALVLATMHRINAKSQLAISGDWAKRLSDGLGTGLYGKTVGTIGFGNIATEFFRLIEPFGCTRLSHDPWKSQSDATPHDVCLVELDELLTRCDVVIVLATLTPETKHLINAGNIGQMKPSAFLINISRGPIVEEVALVNALQSGAIAGAGLDVFEIEPAATTNPLLGIPSVVATPHNLAWTDQLAFGMGRSALSAIVQISNGEIPPYVVNKEVLESPQFLAKIARYRA